MPFWKCYYHVVWATQNRLPVITERIEQIVFEAVKRKSSDLGCPILAINTVEDHVHVALNIPPKIAVADWVRNAKGLSAHEVNTMTSGFNGAFKWQGSYGVVTFGSKHLPFVISYIELQKQHHVNNSLHYDLERVDD